MVRDIVTSLVERYECRKYTCSREDGAQSAVMSLAFAAGQGANPLSHTIHHRTAPHSIVRLSAASRDRGRPWSGATCCV